MNGTQMKLKSLSVHKYSQTDGTNVDSDPIMHPDSMIFCLNQTLEDFVTLIAMLTTEGKR